MKYVMDPCYRAIAPQVPEGAFAVDLGTGLGMLPVLLGLMGRRALGIEWDKAKVACGVHAAQGLDVQIVEGDVRSFAIPACDVITLVDMLHYYDADTQRALLRRCRDALNENGRILVREGDRARRGGARWTRLVENWMVRSAGTAVPTSTSVPSPSCVKISSHRLRRDRRRSCRQTAPGQRAASRAAQRSSLTRP